MDNDKPMTVSKEMKGVAGLLAKLTGGRPMKREGHAFVDAVSGRDVEYRRDSFGRLWMTDGGAWSWFRVPARQSSRSNGAGG